VLPKEITVFRDIGIEITNLRAVSGGRTFDISDIPAVEAKSISASGCAPAALVAFGLFLMGGGVLGEADDIRVKAVIIALGFLPLFGGLLMAFISQPSYVVQLSTTSGEVKAFTSFDRPYIDRIVGALNNAIDQKG
jgi:hypothetical protein